MVYVTEVTLCSVRFYSYNVIDLLMAFVVSTQEWLNNETHALFISGETS